MGLGDLGKIGGADFAKRFEEMGKGAHSQCQAMCWRCRRLQGHAWKNRTCVARGGSSYCYCCLAATVWWQIPPIGCEEAFRWKEKSRLRETEYSMAS